MSGILDVLYARDDRFATQSVVAESLEHQLDSSTSTISYADSSNISFPVSFYHSSRNVSFYNILFAIYFSLLLLFSFIASAVHIGCHPTLLLFIYFHHLHLWYSISWRNFKIVSINLVVRMDRKCQNNLTV